MIRSILLTLGFMLLCIQNYIQPIDSKTQFIIFLSGIILLGVPHGAADLLVATRNADASKKVFSKSKFLSIYIARLFLFSSILWLFPVAGIVLFILFASYHFGETDLYQFKTDTLIGKLFVVSYGLVILCVILLHHFDEVKPILQLFQSGKENEALMNLIRDNRYYIMTISGTLFFICTFIYFLVKPNLGYNEKGEFLIRFAMILFVLFNLPMLLGFTFYFVVWHSVLSIKNIVQYLRNNDAYSQITIVKQILLYSGLAIAGIVMFGLTGFMVIDSNAIAAYTFIGLAVLTAPHMQIMHDMYNRLRLR